MAENMFHNQAVDVSRLQDELRQIIAMASGDVTPMLPDDVPILDLGVTSLALVEGMRQIYDRFGVLVSIRRVLEGQLTLGELALYILQEHGRISTRKGLVSASSQWVVEQDVPMADSQRHVGFLCRYSDEASAAYNESLAVRLKGTLDGPALQTAIEEVGMRYEALRTALNQERDTLSIGTGEALELLVTPAAAVNLVRQLSEIVTRPFPSGRRLFRAELLRISENEHILALVGHSLVLEYQALEFILNDVADLYGIFTRNGEISAAPPVIQWKDYLALENAVEAREARNRSEMFWKRVFAADAPRLELSGDHPRPPVKKYSGERLAAPLESGYVRRLQAWAKDAGIEPAVLFFAAFAGYLHRLTDQPELVIGVESEPLYPQAGIRTIARARDMLPVRSIFEPGNSFAEYVKRQVDILARADAHKYLSFSELVQLLHLPTDQSRSPLFTVAFRSYEQGALPVFEGLESEYYLLPSSGARYDLELTLTFTDSGAWIVCDYSSELFEGPSIAKWLGGIQVFLENGMRNSTQACGMLSVMPQYERNLLIHEWNQTGTPPPGEQTVLEAILKKAQSSLDRPALRYGERVLTYSQLVQRIESIASALDGAGVKNGDHIGILLRRSIDLVPAMLAVWRMGALYVPLDMNFPVNRLAYMLTNANVQVVLANRTLLPRIEGTHVHTLCIEDIRDEPNPNVDSKLLTSGADSAMIIFTSGSTGKPKGVEINHRALLNCLLAAKDYLEFSERSCMFAITTVSFDIASNELLMPLLAGGCVDISEDGLAADGIRISELITARKPSHFQATVSTMKIIMNAGWQGDPEICLISAGEALGRETAEALLSRCDRLWNLYGPTETTVFSTAYRVTSAPGKPIQIGRPFPNTQIYILDKSCQPLPISAVGDLYIGGIGLAAGYWQNPELTNERFIPNPFRPGERIYKTGDLARYLPDGNLVCLGRIDDQVKIHGVRVELGEIEAALRNVDGVKDAVAVSWIDSRGDAQLVGHLITNGNANLTVSELRNKLREHLPEVMIPSHYLFHKVFPLTANGKVQRAALPPPDPARQNSVENKRLETPSTPTEQALAQTWAGILGIDAGLIGRDSNFIDLGGHSLLMTTLLLEVRKLFQVSFSLREFFAAATLRKLAGFIDERQTGESGKTNGRNVPSSIHSAEWARQRMIFLQREAQLPSYIAPDRGLTYQPHEIHNLFFTGATGFLGAYIIAEILKTTKLELYCLVRPKRGEKSKARIENRMRQYDQWHVDDAWGQAWEERLHVIEGDITLPRIGIPDRSYEKLAFEIDAILHGAAHVNFIYPYEALRATNVTGLHEIIQLAFHGRIKPIHHISTAAVWPMGSRHTYFEKDSIDHYGELNLGYDEAKWVSEKCLLNAAERGLPTARYRPGEVGGDSNTGRCVVDHFIFACLKGFLQFGAFPKLDIEVDVAPVDYVAKAIVHLMLKGDSLGRAFHLTNPDRRHMSAALAYLRNIGYQFDELPFEELRDRLVSSPNFSQNALFAYQSVLEEMHSLSMELPTYDTSQTRSELAGSGIACPPADEKLLEKYLNYLFEIDFLPQPELFPS